MLSSIHLCNNRLSLQQTKHISHSMRTKITIIFCFLFTVSQLWSQSPAIQWERSYGGAGEDLGNAIVATSDGGYVFISASNSTNGDVVGNPYAYSSLFVTSYWVVKVDALGVIEWQSTLGGFYDDRPTALKQTADGGFIIAGFSESYDGNITGHVSGYDYWIVKLSATGTLEWQKIAGGNREDRAMDIIQTTDGGYAVIGFSTSTLPAAHGMYEIWLVKLSPAGIIEWHKAYGGSRDDQGYGLLQTTDGGYLIAGKTASVNGNITLNHGATDAWVIKTDNLGIIEWQKTFGGTGEDSGTALTIAPDGNYILLGDTTSTDGDVTSNHGSYDLWVIKMDTSGNILWQQTYGGTEHQMVDLGNIENTTDGGFVFCGRSFAGGIPGHRGSQDAYIVKIDGEGTMQWQRPVGGGNYDSAAEVHQTSDNGYIMIGYNSNSIVGTRDWSVNQGTYDAWVVKFDPDPLLNIETKPLRKLFIYPNPAKNELYLQTSDNLEKAYITISNMMGQKVLETNAKRIINVSNFFPGVYNIVVTSGNSIYKLKFIKE